MKIIIGYTIHYLRTINKQTLLIVSLFTAFLVYINYHYELDEAIRKNNQGAIKLICWYAVFLIAFGLPYLVSIITDRSARRYPPPFIWLLLIAPAIFAVKISTGFPISFSTDDMINNYWQHIIYWPLLLLLTSGILFLVWKLFDRQRPFYGLKTKDLNWRPYWLMLLIMVPLIAMASTQPDFLTVYPKLQAVTGQEALPHWQKLLFELSYGTDFITIELFFRGFLILGFMKWAGKDAILPMACFYCTIHFGKPLGECISSYFGGILLGIVVYNTRSIFGGLLVHLGIAWLMELGGYLGNFLSK